MEIRVRDERLMRAEEIVRKIAEGYLSMLENGFFLRAKLNALDVEISAQEGQISFFSAYDGDERCLIELNFSPDDSDREIALLAAHELAHCLMSNMGLGALGYFPDGEQYISGGVSWRSAGECSDALEEGLADVLAEEVVRRVFGPDVKKKTDFEMNKFLKQVARELAACFGRPLEQMNTLDGKIELGKYVCFKHAVFNDIEVKPAWEMAENEMWYLLTKMSFSLVGECYDKVMGEGAYRKLCARLQEQYIRRSDPSEDALERMIRWVGGGTDEELAEREDILREIREFRRKKRKSMQDVRACERATAADSLREVIERTRKLVGAIKREAERETCYTDSAAKIIEAFERVLHKGRVWQSIPKAYAVLKELERAYVQSEYITQRYIQPIHSMLTAGTEVVRHYKGTEGTDETGESETA